MQEHLYGKYSSELFGRAAGSMTAPRLLALHIFIRSALSPSEISVIERAD